MNAQFWVLKQLYIISLTVSVLIIYNKTNWVVGPLTEDLQNINSKLCNWHRESFLVINQTKLFMQY